MRLSVVAEQLRAPIPGGTGRYTAEVLAALTATARDGDEVVPWYAGARLPGRLVQPLLAEAWRHGRGPAPRGDVVFAPTPLAPPRRNRPLVVTLHDAVPWTLPETLTARGARWHQAMERRVGRDADVVLVPTHAVAADLTRHLPLRRVEIVGEGVSAAVATPPPDAPARAARLQLPDRFALTVGTREPRKRLDVVLAALAGPGWPKGLPLLVVGPSGWGAQPGEVPAAARFLGRLDEADLATVYARASVVVLASQAEGFGLPVVEAMAHGVPVVVSDAPALVEVAGDAGLVVPRGDAAALADAVRRAGEDRDRLGDASRRRAQQWSWTTVADRIWEICRELSTAAKPPTDARWKGPMGVAEPLSGVAQTHAGSEQVGRRLGLGSRLRQPMRRAVSPRVLVDATAVPADRGGVGRYVDGLIAALGQLDADLAVVCQRADAERYGRMAPQAQVVPGPAAISHRPARLAWEQTGLALVAEQVGAQVIHSPHYTMPLRAGRPVVVTIHDATFFTEPELHTPVKGTFFRSATRTALRRAARCIVPSKATRDEVIRILDADPTRLDVAYHGVDTNVFHPPSEAEKERVRLRLGLGHQPYVAFLGALEPRKNVPNLIRGWVEAVHWRDEPPALVLAGGSGWDDEVDEAIAAVPPNLRVLRPGYLRFADLPGYLGGASVVAYPSHGEGFGLPVLEAMACGVPVLTTPRLSLPEVGGDAVAYTQPDADSIGRDLGELLSDPERRAELGRRGLARAREFTWTASAEAHLASYARAVGE